jgi:hypothetical protein
VDASLIHTDANKQRSLPRAEWIAQGHLQEAPRAVREDLAAFDEAACVKATQVEPTFVSLFDPAAQWTSVSRSPSDADDIAALDQGPMSSEQGQLASVRSSLLLVLKLAFQSSIQRRALQIPMKFARSFQAQLQLLTPLIVPSYDFNAASRSYARDGRRGLADVA